LLIAPTPGREIGNVEEIGAGATQQPEARHRSASALRAKLVEDAFEGRVLGNAADLSLLERGAEGLATLLLQFDGFHAGSQDVLDRCVVAGGHLRLGHASDLGR